MQEGGSQGGARMDLLIQELMFRLMNQGLRLGVATGLSLMAIVLFVALSLATSPMAISSGWCAV